MVDAVDRTTEKAMRNEPLHTIESGIHQLCLASLHRDAQHIQQLCKGQDAFAQYLLECSWVIQQGLALPFGLRCKDVLVMRQARTQWCIGEHAFKRCEQAAHCQPGQWLMAEQVP